MSMSTRDVLLVLANVEAYHDEVRSLLEEYPKRYAFSAALRDYVEELAYEEAGFNPMQAELMMTALAHVNWAEVSDDYYNEYHGVEA